MFYVLFIMAASVIIWYAFQPDKKRVHQVGINNLKMFGCKDSGYHLSVWPNVPGVGSCLEFPIAGVTFRDGIDKYLGEFEGRLVPEPDNPHDANAIRIEAPDGHKVGYVPKDMTYEVRCNVSLPHSCCCFITNHNGYYITDCYVKLPK